MAEPIWTTACPDWVRRITERRSLIPFDPLFPDEAAQAVEIFKALRVVDLPGKPTFGECSPQWVFDFVAAIFGAYNPETGEQLIREFYLLISKKNFKSTVAAGIMMTALILCWREDEEHLILAPTKEVAENSFKPAAGMVRADEELSALFHVQDHVRTITHRETKASLKVVAADTDTVSGKKSGRVLVDEHWLFGKKPNAEAMFFEALGGQVSRPEGWVIYLTTQSDEQPAGVFKDKLELFRNIRDGLVEDKRKLGVLYEFPPEMVSAEAYLKRENWYITNPSQKEVGFEWIAGKLVELKDKRDGPLQQFLAKHLNVEIGLRLRSNRWAGAEFWERAVDPALRNLQNLLERSEVAVVGIDGGGLDDLLGLCVIGRERETRRWLAWFRAWAHRIVLERRTDIATQLQQFAADGDLVFVELPGQDVEQVADIVCQVRDFGLLPEKNAIGVDAAGIADIVDELMSPLRSIAEGQIVAVSQGWRLNAAIKTMERRVARAAGAKVEGAREDEAGGLIQGGGALMNWCAGNAKVEAKGNAVMITKQSAGNAKIDPLMAGFNAASLMALNPSANVIGEDYQLLTV